MGVSLLFTRDENAQTHRLFWDERERESVLFFFSVVRFVISDLQQLCGWWIILEIWLCNPKKKRDEGVEGVEGASSATRQRRGRGRNRRNDLETWKRKRAAKSLVVARQRGRFCHVFVQNRYVGWSKNRKEELFFRGRQEASRDLFSEIFAALARFFFKQKISLSLVLIKNNQSKPTNERTKHFFSSLSLLFQPTN